MKQDMLISGAVMFSMATLCAIAAWLSGFNFDHRSPDVAAGFVFSVIFSFGCGTLTWSIAQLK